MRKVQVGCKHLAVAIRHVKTSLRHRRSIAIRLAGSTVLQDIQMQLVDNPRHAV